MAEICSARALDGERKLRKRSATKKRMKPTKKELGRLEVRNGREI